MYFAIWVRFAFLSSLVVLRADYSAFIFRVLPSGEIARKRKRVTDEEDMVDLIALDDGSLISVLRSHGANSLHIERYDTDGNVTLEYYNPPARPTSASSSPDGGLYLAGTVYECATMVDSYACIIIWLLEESFYGIRPKTPRQEYLSVPGGPWKVTTAKALNDEGYNCQKRVS